MCPPTPPKKVCFGEVKILTIYPDSSDKEKLLGHKQRGYPTRIFFMWR